MNLYQKLIAPFTVLISLLTAGGVLLHDTNTDKAFLSAWTVTHPNFASDDTGKIRPGSMPHTHAERVSLSDTIREGNANPRTTPRSNDRKHLWHKRVAKENHEFDGFRLMIDSFRA